MKFFSRQNYYFPVSDLFDRFDVVIMEEINVENGNLYAIKTLVMRKTLVNYWFLFIFILPIIVFLNKYIFHTKFNLITSCLIFLLCSGLFFWSFYRNIKKINADNYLERLVDIKNIIKKKIDYVDFSKNVRSLENYIDALELLSPHIQFVPLRELPPVVCYPKYELFKSIMMVIMIHATYIPVLYIGSL